MSAYPRHIGDAAIAAMIKKNDHIKAGTIALEFILQSRPDETKEITAS